MKTGYALNFGTVGQTYVLLQHWNESSIHFSHFLWEAKSKTILSSLISRYLIISFPSKIREKVKQRSLHQEWVIFELHLYIHLEKVWIWLSLWTYDISFRSYFSDWHPGKFFRLCWFLKEGRKRVNVLKAECLLALLPCKHLELCSMVVPHPFPSPSVSVVQKIHTDKRHSVMLRERISWSELREGWWWWHHSLQLT